MFDIWWGTVELTTLILIISVVVLMPLQVLICFKVKSLNVRLLPVICLSIVSVALVLAGLMAQGWDGLGYAILAAFTGFMLFMCGIGWGIWGIVRYIKKRN